MKRTHLKTDDWILVKRNHTSLCAYAKRLIVTKKTIVNKVLGIITKVRRERERERERETETETDRQTDRQTDRDTDRQTDRGTDRDTERDRQGLSVRGKKRRERQRKR